MTTFGCQSSPVTLFEALSSSQLALALQEPPISRGEGRVVDSCATVPGIHLVSGDLDSSLRLLQEVLLPLQLASFLVLFLLSAQSRLQRDNSDTHCSQELRRCQGWKGTLRDVGTGGAPGMSAEPRGPNW